VQLGVHPGLEDGDAPQLVELGGVGVEVECAGDDHVEPSITRFAGGGDQVGAGDGAELRADEDRCAVASVRWPVTSISGR